MPYVEGETLEQRMKPKQLDLSESLTIAGQVADALDEAHSHGIVHRDIKPSNIMITPRGQARIMDFGLAKLASGAVENEAETQSFLTTPGMILGTVPYMSPEQLKGETVDARTDIFSFGVVFYEMLSGRRPFARQTAAETISAILHQEPPALADLPAELSRITHKCLEKDRSLRYQRAADILVDLQRLKRDTESRQGTNTPKSESPANGSPQVPRRYAGVAFAPQHLIVPAGLVVLALMAAGYLYYSRAAHGRAAEIKSLAVLPLKSLDAGDNYLGLGIADAAIRKISQTGKVIVRPTSAVIKYGKGDTDALSAAKELGVDAVLEGSFQRADNTVRVSVNLLRTSDGMSLWSDQYDLRTTDIFTIQDAVAQQVAANLRLQLDASQQAQLAKHYTSNATAYEHYVKGVYVFDQRVSAPRASLETAIDSFKQAIQVDPNFALAHAQLAYVYATMSTFVEPTESAWADRAGEEISRAQGLDPQLAEIHLARFMLLFGAAEGYQAEAAIREVLLARQLNPNVGHAELGYLFFHVGLGEAGARELQRALEIDPTSEFAREMVVLKFQVACEYDKYFVDRQKLYAGNPPAISEAWYLMSKGRWDEAAKELDKMVGRSDVIQSLPKRALLAALQGDFHTAEAAVPDILKLHPAKDPLYHHATYDIACIYALEGKSADAVKWLREGADNGFSPYSLFECDPNLNRIRQAAEFVQFMSEMKALNERYQREFGQSYR
jgi:TolB-like protein